MRPFLAGNLPCDLHAENAYEKDDNHGQQTRAIHGRLDARMPSGTALVAADVKSSRQQEDFSTDPARLDAATHTAAALATEEDSGD